MRGEPINALKTAMINTIQYINDDNYIGILDELLAILADSDDRARTHNLSGRDTLSPLVRGGVMHRLRTLRTVSMQPRQHVTFNAAKSQHIDSGNIRSMANRVQMSEYDMSWTNNTILSAANLIGRVFAGSNLSHEEALSEWLMKYRTQIESATKCIKKATLPGLNSAGTTAAIIVAAMNDVPAIYIEKFMDVFYSGFTNNEAEHYAITLRDELLRENRVKRGTQYARFAFFRTANRLNQYYKTATGQRVAKRVNNGDFPYNVYDANGGIVKPETKKTKKAG